MTHVLTTLLIVILFVFAFPGAFLEILRRYRKKSREFYARNNGYQKMIDDLGKPAWWDYPLDLEEETKRK